MSHSTELSRPWSEAQRRAAIYLRTLRGRFGAAERRLVAEALRSARGQGQLNQETHPVTLVMEALFDSLSAVPNEPPPTTPPLRRTTMLPEPIEFPVHDWFRGLFRRIRLN
jgi:hypothetical protein